MSISGIHGQLLEVTVVGCTRLKDTEWISRQDPYVCVEYGSTRFRTRTCTDGGKNPKFQEKFVFTLIEGLRELNITVWNSNTLTIDDFIGKGKVQLQKALSQGFDDSSWTLETKTGRYAGEVRLIIHYANANKAMTSFAPSAPPYAAPVPQVPPYSMPPPPPASATPYGPPASATPYAPPATAYSATAYQAPPPYSSYPPNSAYPPRATYPPQPAPYQTPPYPPGSYPGYYPPPPY